jgi:hypothetical protein
MPSGRDDDGAMPPNGNWPECCRGREMCGFMVGNYLEITGVGREDMWRFGVDDRALVREWRIITFETERGV